MTFGDRIDQEGANKAVAFAREQGINFFDTADIYIMGNSGISEKILGEALKPYRQDVVLATKTCGPMGPDPNDRGLSRRHVVASVEGSLRRLQTDYIDILYYHFPDPLTSAEEAVTTANDLIRQGKIRYYGVSNFSAWEICEMIFTAKQLGMRPPVVTESVYNLVTRGIEDELLPLITKYPTGLTVYNPLAGGLLTGKYKSLQNVATGTRFGDDKGYASRYLSEANLKAIAELGRISEELGISMIELALGWLNRRKGVTSTILGFSRMEQLQQNLEAIEKTKSIALPEDQLDAVWQQLRGNIYSYHK